MKDMRDPETMPINYAKRAMDFAFIGTRIFTERSKGSAATIGQIVSENGFENENDFWNTALSETIKVGLFVHLMRDCLIPPAFHQTPRHPRSWLEEIDHVENCLNDAMRKAFDSGEGSG